MGLVTSHCNLLWSQQKNNFPCKDKTKPFQDWFSTVWSYRFPLLTVTLCPAWACPDISPCRDSPVKVTSWLSTLWVTNILLTALTESQVESFSDTPQKTNQQKLKSSPFPDVRPAAVFVGMICYAVSDRLFFISSPLMFSLRYTINCFLLLGKWTVVKNVFFGQEFRPCTEKELSYW